VLFSFTHSLASSQTWSGTLFTGNILPRWTVLSVWLGETTSTELGLPGWWQMLRADWIAWLECPYVCLILERTLYLLVRLLVSFCSWIEFDSLFLFFFSRQGPVKYTLRHGYTAPGHALRNWQFQGSADGKNWVTMRNHVNVCFRLIGVVLFFSLVCILLAFFIFN
jgi:hypothetical protein